MYKMGEWGIKGARWENMKKLKGDHLMMTWHDNQNQPEIGFDGQNVIIKMTLDKPVHKETKLWIY